MTAPKRRRIVVELAPGLGGEFGLAPNSGTLLIRRDSNPYLVGRLVIDLLSDPGTKLPTFD